MIADALTKITVDKNAHRMLDDVMKGQIKMYTAPPHSSNQPNKDAVHVPRLGASKKKEKGVDVKVTFAPSASNAVV